MSLVIKVILILNKETFQQDDLTKKIKPAEGTENLNPDLKGNAVTGLLTISLCKPFLKVEKFHWIGGK